MTNSRSVAVSAAGPAMLTKLTDRAFLDAIVAAGPTSRAQIARLTGLSKPTVSEAALRLVAAGVLVELGPAVTEGRGRGGVLYGLDPDRGHAATTILERGNVVVRATRLDSTPVFERRVSTDHDLPSAISTARGLLVEAAAAAGTPRLGTAVSVAAPVEPVTHVVRSFFDSPFTGVVGDVGAALGIAPGESTVVDNDVNWATMAESRLPGMVDRDDFLNLYIGAGIGAGLYLSGRLHRGTRGLAGEIAFLRTPAGPSVMRVLAAGPLGSADGRSIDLVCAARELGDRRRFDLLDPVIDAIAAFVTVIDPGLVVLGGPVAVIDGVLDAIREGLAERTMVQVDVELSGIEDQAPLEGAASGALDLARAVAFG